VGGIASDGFSALRASYVDFQPSIPLDRVEFSHHAVIEESGVVGTHKPPDLAFAVPSESGVAGVL
jgi:hypothetical protein